MVKENLVEQGLSSFFYSILPVKKKFSGLFLARHPKIGLWVCIRFRNHKYLS